MPSSEVHPTLRVAPPTLPLGERVNFASVFEGLAKAFGAAQVRDEFKALGVDLDHLQAAYPHSVFIDAVAVLAKKFFPQLPPDEAWFQVGVRNLEGFYDTLLGRPLFALLRLMGPRRAAARMKSNFRSANNYSESKLVEVAPRELQLWMNDTGLVRSFIAGVMHRGLQMAGADGIRVEALATDEAGTVYRITW